MPLIGVKRARSEQDYQVISSTLNIHYLSHVDVYQESVAGAWILEPFNHSDERSDRLYR